MYKNDDPTATAIGEFTDGDPLNGVPPSVLRSAWVNMIQRELLSVVQGAGIVPNKEQEDQLFQAVKKLNSEMLASAKSYADQLVATVPQVEIVQGTGASEDSVMSQKSVTGALASKSETGHGHSIDNIDGLETALNNKAAKTANGTTLGGIKINFSDGVLNIRTDSQNA